MNQIQIVKYLEKYKQFFGLADFKILVADEFFEMGDAFCMVDLNELEKTVKIKLSVEFKKEPKASQESKLIHELIHARVDLFNKEKEKVNDIQEEYLVNDLERGFYSLIRR